MKKTMNKVDVLIPCYNEDKNIETLINSWASVAKKNQDLNIYFIDNGSTDSTNKALKGFIENLNLPNLFILEIEINKGYGHGIKFGLSLSHSQIVCWTHADLQIPVEEVVEVIKEYSSINDREKFIFKGKRIKRNVFDKLFTNFMSIIGYFYTGYFIKDINAQPKVFSRSNLNAVDQFPDDFSIDAHILYLHKKNNKTIKAFDTHFFNRTGNKSKGGGSFKGKLMLSYKTFKYLKNFKKNIS